MSVVMRYGPFLILMAALTALSVIPAAALSTGEDPPKDKAGWITALSQTALQGTDRQMVQTFFDTGPEVVYSVLQEGWERIENDNVRLSLMQRLVSGANPRVVNDRIDDGYTPNPHLVDILALGLADASGPVRTVASKSLSGIAFREIKTLEQFKEWRSAAGDKPVGDLIEAGCRSAMKILDISDKDGRQKTLRFLLTLQFYSGRYSSNVNGVSTHGVLSYGLDRQRREAALSSGLVEAVARCLKSDNAPLIQQLAVKLIAHIMPTDPALKRVETDLKSASPEALGIGDAYEVYELLGEVKERWATDLLIDRIAQGDPLRVSIAGVLGNSGDARAIPSLIALYAAAGPHNSFGQIIERSLTQLTGVPYQLNSDHDGDWWRDWWQDHKAQLPLDVASMPFPRLPGVSRSEGFSPRRHIERRVVDMTLNRNLSVSGIDKRENGADAPGISRLPRGPKVDYLLISPGLISVPSERQSPGLVVVMADRADSSIGSVVWQAAAGKAWSGAYLVALVARPDAPELSGQVSAPRLLAAVVKDAMARASVDPKHVYLYGHGAAGQVVYACSLERETAIQGFVLDSAPFRPAQLPPLSAAKGRKYYLLHEKSNKDVPYFLATAAESLLKKQGAAVMLAPAGTPAASDATAWNPGWISALRGAIQWLEERDGRNKH